MNFSIEGGSDYPMLHVDLQPGETIVAEAGAMAWMDSHIETTVSTRGGLGKGLKRALLGGESLFQNTFSVKEKAGTLALVPGEPGPILHEHLTRGRELFMQAGAYLASSEGIELDTKYEGLKGLLSEGMFTLRVHGQGDLFFSGYGGVEEVEVHGEYVVDNGYAVAWEPSLSYSISKTGKKIRSFLFGDQLVVRFKGNGRLWVQSHAPRALANFFYPYRRVRKRSRSS